MKRKRSVKKVAPNISQSTTSGTFTSGWPGPPSQNQTSKKITASSAATTVPVKNPSSASMKPPDPSKQAPWRMAAGGGPAVRSR